MNYCIKLLLILMPLLLAACTTADEQAAQATRSSPVSTIQPRTPAPNFAFIYRYHPCGIDDTEIWDTAKGRFTALPLGSTTATTIPLVPTADQLAQFYKQIETINFFDYPSEFRISVADDQSQTISVPAPTYTLTVINGGRSHTVKWLDEIREPTTAEAEQLRGLLNTITAYLQARPEMKQLPAPQAGCA